MDDNIEHVPKVETVRRSLTVRSNAARQVAVNFMPSRQLPHNSNRLRRSNSEQNALLETDTVDGPGGPDAQADIIVREMEQHRQLMEDDPGAEELRREALRDLPQGLTMKRHVRAKLSASVSLRSKRKPISMWRRMKYRISFAWKRSRDRFRDFIFSIELWYEAIRNIEGNFGSAVGSYFYFLRWLFAADLVLMTLVLAFVVVPQALHDNEEGVGVSRSGFLDFVSGKGSFEDTLLFFGHYYSGDISAKASPLTYNMPFAYFFTMVCLYLGVFGVLCYRTAYSYRHNFIDISGGRHLFASKVFCGWDFGIVSYSAAALTHTGIFNELKELLNEQNKPNEMATLLARTFQNLTNVIVNLLVVSGVVAMEYGLWQLLSLDTTRAHWEILVSLAVTAAVTVMPVLFNLVGRLEFYQPRTALYVSLARTWLVDVGTLMLLFYYWTKADATCWETSFGQEAYRLVLFESLVSLFILPIVELGRGLLYKANLLSNPPEFNIAYNSLTVLYNQAVVWCGLLFSPLLAVCVTAKLCALFYVKRESALRVCKPARKIWRASQTQTVLYMLVTLSLFTTLFAFGTLFFRIPSKQCGPFTQYDYVYHVISEGVLRLSHHPRLAAAILFFTRPGIVGFAMLALCVSVYLMRARAKAQNSMVEILRHMLVMQAKDKDFLLAAIAKVSNGEWLYSPKPEEPGSSHTWKYLNEVRKPSNAGFQLDASRSSHHDRPGSERPRSYDKSRSYERPRSSDGETDSSFSWQGSTGRLEKDAEKQKKWI